MKKFKLSPLAAAAGLVVLVNLIVLAGVRYNRSGSPTAVLVLDRSAFFAAGYPFSEGQGSLPHRGGVERLLLTDRLADEAYVPPGRQAGWLSDKGLTAIGAPPPPTHPRQAGQRFALDRSVPVFVALQWEGPAYADAVARCERRAEVEKTPAEQAAYGKICARARENTHLMMMDIDTDARRLRAHYPSSDVAVVPAQLRFSQQADGSWTPSVEKPPIAVTPSEDLRWQLQALTSSRRSGSVVVAFGQRYEPWLIEVRAAGTP
jgi:hypothetical protein